MKKGKKNALLPISGQVAADFARGAIAAGLLTAVQDRWTEGAKSNRLVACRAVQGGVALAVGIAAADGLRQGNYSRALLAVAAGMVGVAAAERVLNPVCEDVFPAIPAIEEADLG